MTALKTHVYILFRQIASDYVKKRVTYHTQITHHMYTHRSVDGGKVTLGATKTTLMSSLKSTPSFFKTPSRKPCDNPRVAPGFMAARILG